MTRAVVTEALGLGHLPDNAPVEVEVTLADESDGERRLVECEGYVGGGYWRGDVTAARALLELFVDDAAARTHLRDPARVLDAVADVGRRDLDHAAARAALAQHLTGCGA